MSAWYALAVSGFFAALAFVYIGSWPAEPPRAASSLPLFAIGAGLAWLAFRQGEWGSPYRGIAELVVTYLGGVAGVLFSQSDGRLSRATLFTTIALFLGFVVVACAEAFWFPRYGLPAIVYRPERQFADVRFLWVNEYSRAVVWSQASDALWAKEAVARGLLDLETDIGSGPTQARARVVHPNEIRTFEMLGQSEMTERIESEGRRYVIPRVFMSLPYRSLALDADAVVQAEWTE